MYGHIDKLADAMEEGVKASGASATRFQLPETLSAEVLEKMHAGSKNAHPVLDDPEKLKVSPTCGHGSLMFYCSKNSPRFVAGIRWLPLWFPYSLQSCSRPGLDSSFGYFNLSYPDGD